MGSNATAALQVLPSPGAKRRKLKPSPLFGMRRFREKNARHPAQSSSSSSSWAELRRELDDTRAALAMSAKRLPACVNFACA
jgi:hypothetical protein